MVRTFTHSFLWREEKHIVINNINNIYGNDIHPYTNTTFALHANLVVLTEFIHYLNKFNNASFFKSHKL